MVIPNALGIGDCRKIGAIHDSGERRTFESGAVRDTAQGKPRPDLVSPLFMLRIGQHLAEGAKKYAERNWEQGISQARCLESLERHIMQYKMGLQDEDHLAAMACNIMFMLHNDEMIRRGLMSESLNDLPFYLQKQSNDPIMKAHATEVIRNEA